MFVVHLVIPDCSGNCESGLKSKVAYFFLRHKIHSTMRGISFFKYQWEKSHVEHVEPIYWKTCYSYQAGANKQ